MVIKQTLRDPKRLEISRSNQQGSEQPGLVEDVPAHCRGLGWMSSKGPFQPKAFYDSMIL